MYYFEDRLHMVITSIGFFITHTAADHYDLSFSFVVVSISSPYTCPQPGHLFLVFLMLPANVHPKPKYQPQYILIPRFLYCDPAGLGFFPRRHYNLDTFPGERNFAVAQDTCFLTVLPMRNLSIPYKSVINKESLMFPEILGLQDFSGRYNYFIFHLSLSRK